MKVILSVDPIKFPLTGIGRYTYELACGLQRSGLESLRFLHGRHLRNTLPAHAAKTTRAGRPTWRGYAMRSRSAVAAYRLVYPWLRGRALQGLEDHVFHGPNFYLPPFAGRSVVTVHDLSPYSWAQSHPPERVRYMRAEIELSLQRASLLITDTEYTRREVADFFSFPLARIHAVPLASAAEFVPRSPQSLQAVLQPLGLTAGGYALFTGTVEPRKNLDVLLTAYERLPVCLRRRWPLVIAGYQGWRSEAIHARLQAAEKAGWLRYLGFVAHDTLPALMAGARLFVYPSLYEGFGLPVLEAMACAVPVVCSNASTLPEVAGSAPAFHDPADGETLLALLQMGLEDDHWREKAAQTGLLQAQKFSWERCTQQTLAVYRAASLL